MPNKSYIISVSLGGGCYRHIRISTGAILMDLHAAILNAFQFDDDHEHAFFMDNRLWSDEDSYYSEGIEDADRFSSEYKLDDAGLHVGKPFKYVFDFGDEWKYQCKVLKVLDEETLEPQVIKSVGDAPMQYDVACKDLDNDKDDGDDDPEATIFPETYDDEKLKKMYAGLALPKETVQLLLQYFDAFANLYGIIPLRKALEIYIKQNELVAEEDFAAFAEVARHEEHMYSILGEDDLFSDCNELCGPLDREIIAEHVLIGEDDYEELKAEQGGKPYYIPSKRTLLKYADDFYFEQNAEFCALRDFLSHHMKLSANRTNDVASDMQLFASMADQNYQRIINDMARMGVKFNDAKDMESFFDLYEEMFNNTRMSIHRGHTPNEINKESGTLFDLGATKVLRRGSMDFDKIQNGVMKTGHPTADPMDGPMGEPNRIEDEVKTDATNYIPLTENVSRNTLCPCGSGKKYKRCCGMKPGNLK